MAYAYILAAILNIIVNFFLIHSAAAICNSHMHIGRAAVGSLLNSFVLLAFNLFGPRSNIAAIIASVITSLAAFIRRRNALCESVVYLLLQVMILALSKGLNIYSISVVALAGGCIFAIYQLLGRSGSFDDLIDVEIKYEDKTVKLKALRDTGNSLLDPLTGRSVLVVGAKTAQRLLGLTKCQLSNPIEAVESNAFPGLRLVPFKTVGQSNGMLLALKFQNVKIGEELGSRLVAFAPEGLTGDTGYDALAGGVL